MRLSTGCMVYAAGALLLLPLALLGVWWPAALWLAAGGLLLAAQLRTLEKGIGVMADEDVFRHYTARVRWRPVRGLLGQVGRQMETLQKQYSTSMEDINSRMGSLQSQINPHFLYNTLECIRSEALLQGNVSIAQMSKALGLFFRYSISRKENIVTIQEELDNLHNYFIIQNYRFEDRFSLSIVVEDENDDLLDCLIPKMTLQPLVENCIFHGLEPKTGDGVVCVRILAAAQRLVLVVSDNGVGMDEGQLAALRRSIETQAEGSAQGAGNGVALYNVNQRLCLAFGETAGLQVYSALGLGTDVEMALPMLRDRGALRL